MSRQSRELEFTRVQEEVLAGTTLGDAFMLNPYNKDGVKVKNSNIQIEHGVAQSEYCRWKAEVLGLKTFYRDRYDGREGREKTYHSIYAYSESSPTYTAIYDRVYNKGGKKALNETILNSLGELGLTIWYCDDGSLNPKDRVVKLHTDKYSYRENIIIKEWFQERWGLNPTIYKKNSPGGTKYFLSFSVEDSYRFIEIVKPYVPTEDLMYKTAIKPYKRTPEWLKDILSQDEEESNNA